MNLLPAMCPVSLTLGANRAIWIFGDMRPQVMLRELPLNMFVDFLHVGAARDVTEPSAHPLPPPHPPPPSHLHPHPSRHSPTH